MVPPWLRFHIPLIEPDRQISRIRLSDKTSRFHPRHVVLKPTQADEFEMPVRCEWISHRPPSDRHVGFSFVVGGGGRCCRCSRRLVAPLRHADYSDECRLSGAKRKKRGHRRTVAFDPNRSRTSLPTTDRLRGPRCWLTASCRYDMLMLLPEENGVMACPPIAGARPAPPRKSMR